MIIYKDGAHVEYVLSVRHLVEKIGFAAFSKSNSGESIIHYGPQNMKSHKGYVPSSRSRRRSPGSYIKCACYVWNSDSGCHHTEDECRYTHKCAKCGSKLQRMT